MERHPVYSEWHRSHVLSRDKKGAKDCLNKWKSHLIVLSESGYCVNFIYEFSSPDETSFKGEKSRSSSWSSSSRGKGKSTPSSSEKTTQSVSSTRASSRFQEAEGRRLFLRWRRAPSPTRKAILVIFKVVMDVMPGASTHQPLDDVDTVERPGELDDVCCSYHFASMRRFAVN